MKILHLTLKKCWFDMIATGIKTEEYREIKHHWDVRLLNKQYDIVQFRNGYQKIAPVMQFELLSISKGIGLIEWGAPSIPVYVIKLGKALQNG